MAKAKGAAAKIQELPLEQFENFEASFSKIESIVRQLEQGTLGLEQSLGIYQSAVAHLRFCQQQLAQAQRQVEVLREVQPDGSYSTEAFDDTASSMK